jgi:predicted phosphodiesterase
MKPSVLVILLMVNNVRLAVLSDIHGNFPALQAIIDDMQQFDVDHVVVAGDSINWAPFSVAVMQRMMAENWAVIRGNHEMYLLEWGRPEVPEYRRNWSIPRWLNTVIPPDIRRVIAALPDTLTLLYRDVPPIRVLHGSPGDHWCGIYYQTTDDEIEEMLSSVEQETVIVGHTHLPMDRQSGRWHIFNPGSVGVPLDGVHGASYLLLESDGGPWQPTFVM